MGDGYDCWMKTYQIGFFDEERRLERLQKLNDPLVDLAKIVDFEMFRPKLSEAFARIQAERKSAAGRKPMDSVFMFKILILQRMHNLSDPQTEIQILDRSTFRRFLEISAEEDVPDFTTVWRFRDALSKAEAIKPLFDVFGQMLVDQGVILKAGTIIDATFIEVPRQRNTREENETIKRGEVPENWKSNPRKLSQKDLDARWTKKNEETYYGYKNHIRADAGSLIIADYEVTDASLHDSQVLERLVTEENRGEALFADSAYRSVECDARLKELGVGNYIHQRGVRNKPLGEIQKALNTLRSKIRCTVEHIFGFMENSMGGPRLEYIGWKRISAGVGIANLTYNICRYLHIVRMGCIRRN